MFIVFKNTTKENFQEIQTKLSLYKEDITQSGTLEYDKDDQIGITIKDHYSRKEGYILNCIKEEDLHNGDDFFGLNYYTDYVETDDIIETINILKSSLELGLL